MPDIPLSPAAGAVRRRTRNLLVSLAAAAVGVSVLAAAPVARSAPSSECPRPYPVTSVSKGQPVTGRTVTSGTEPTGFSGEVIGVIRDGIAPGLDMVMARLSSPEIDRVGGIWQGMSGSPVYAADGRLVGAVAYGMASGPSPVAGITPAAEMYRLLSDAPTNPTARARLRAASAADTVAIPPTMQRRLVADGTAARQETRDGMGRLPLPLGISGMVSAARLAQAEKAFNLSGVRVHQSGSVSAADEALPVVAGGNLAASLSYGDVSAIGVGTATAVCGEEVLAFGHPMAFTGPSQMTMHGADAVYIQEDPVGPPFKLANAGAPIGSIDQDRLSGLFGLQNLAAVPETTDVTSYVEVPGEWSRTGTTRISVPDAVPDIAAFHLLADQDRVYDGIGGGSATIGWTVVGTRADGRRFRFARTDRWTNEWDISYEPTWDLYDQLARLHFNDVEQVSLDTVTTTSTMTRQYAAYQIATVRHRHRGRWRELRTDRPLVLRPGTTKRFRVRLTSSQLGPSRVEVALQVPERIGRKSGILEILGGNSHYPDGGGEFAEEEGFGSAAAPPTFGALLRRLRREPRNDQVLAELMLFRRDGSATRRSARTDAGAVVNGGVAVEVQGAG
jgi:hypothetical protein